MLGFLDRTQQRLTSNSEPYKDVGFSGPPYPTSFFLSIRIHWAEAVLQDAALALHTSHVLICLCAYVLVCLSASLLSPLSMAASWAVADFFVSSIEVIV